MICRAAVKVCECRVGHTHNFKPIRRITPNPSCVTSYKIELYKITSQTGGFNRDI